jgi:putative radical SAM enzyme (TIGR03279 family)
MNPACSADGAAATTAEPDGVVVAAVERRSAAGEAGLRPGDRIVAIGRHALRDAIDFQFHAAGDRLRLTVDRDGTRHAMVLDRRPGGLGLELAPPRPRDIATCANKCVFCFIHQNPRGLRKSLYVKDDDYRLSFLHGNYITLSDLDEAALARIESQRLSPLYVSVHATDPALRHALLGRPRHPAEILPRMARLARAGIRMHAQIVLCPGLNDGAHLDRTVHDLARLHPAVTTTAIVPVGLTRHRERLPALRSLTAGEAQGLVDTVSAWQAAFLASLGTRFAFVADEVFLLAGRPLPPAEAYEGFPVAEDGVGLVRKFEDEVDRATRRPAAAADRALTVVTGELYGPRLARRLASLAPRARVVAVPNELFGRSIGVAGLLSGRDIQRHLARQHDLGDEVLLPAVCVRDADGVFLDDLTPADLAADLGVRVRVVEPSGQALLRALAR